MINVDINLIRSEDKEVDVAQRNGFSAQSGGTAARCSKPWCALGREMYDLIAAARSMPLPLWDALVMSFFTEIKSHCTAAEETTDGARSRLLCPKMSLKRHPD